ncbi:collagen alpha-1(III) chain-like [Pan troglodytes]|uniref:collagen alpha-1(III) chain-like n=1 Tax=Pan troglodytes TaxID=9598 RepID=UPI0030137A9E
MAGCRSRALLHREAAKARREIEPSARWAGTAGGPGAPSALLARVLSHSLPGPAGPAGRSECGPAKPTPTRNSGWPASAALTPGSCPSLSLHTSLQAEGAGSGLGHPRKGLPQCSGGLKGFSSATRVGAEAEEAPRASPLSPLRMSMRPSPDSTRSGHPILNFPAFRIIILILQAADKRLGDIHS